jgi:hypothetical protein
MQQAGKSIRIGIAFGIIDKFYAPNALMSTG